LEGGFAGLLISTKFIPRKASRMCDTENSRLPVSHAERIQVERLIFTAKDTPEVNSTGAE
jgi:hypothetical protein